MTFADIETYRSDPQFQEMMRRFQAGEWQPGLDQLTTLEEKYPLERDLRTLRQEMTLRAKIDDDEVQDIRHERRQDLSKAALRIVGIVLLVMVFYFGISTYLSWFQEQVANVQQQYERERAELTLSVKFRSAQELLNAGRTTEALALFQEVAQEKPDFPDLNTYLAQTQTQVDLEAKYTQAIAFIDEGDSSAALVLLQEIEAQEQFFRDVPFQIRQIEQKFLLDGFIEQGRTAFQEERWTDAITAFESLRALDETFNAEIVEDLLYRSYLKAAEATVSDPEQTLDALRAAEEYYSKALALRPRDQQALVERAEARRTIEERLVNGYIDQAEAALFEQADSLQALAQAEYYYNEALEVQPGNEFILVRLDNARKYIYAVEAFARRQWDDVINALEPVYVLDPEYAGGTGRQTLYEAYVARGRENIARGEYPDALSDFQRAAVLAQSSPDSIARLFESQILVAQAMGLMGDYQGAVFLYRAAISDTGLDRRAVQRNADMAFYLSQAESFSGNGDYRNAYSSYREALALSLDLYDVTIHVVKGGDYLTMLARKYNTTVQAILDVNGLTNTTKIDPNLELIIPSIEG